MAKAVKQKEVKYLNKDFKQFRNNLIDVGSPLAQHPLTLNDLVEPSFIIQLPDGTPVLRGLSVSKRDVR